MYFIKQVLNVSAVLLIVLVSCNRHKKIELEDIAEGITLFQQGSLKISMNYFFNHAALKLAPTTFITAAGDTIKIDELKYYLSNIVLTRADGKTVSIGEYYLETFTPSAPRVITIANIPAGNYVKISYLLGVDSLANSSGMHGGALDPSYNMYWPWNTGYVFFRLNGQHTAKEYSYGFDIGGNANLMRVEHSLRAYKISGATLTISLKFDLARVFNAPNKYDLERHNNSIHSSGAADILMLVKNIEGAFSISSVN